MPKAGKWKPESGWYNKHIFQLLALLTISFTCASQQINADKLTRRQFDSLHMLRLLKFNGTTNRKPLFPQRQVSLTQSLRTVTTARITNLNAAICRDTSGRYFLRTDSLTYYVTSSLYTSDGNVLVSGECVATKTNTDVGGFLMKCNDTGNVQWSRTYDSAGRTGYNFINYYKLLELSDGSYLMAGSTNNPKTHEDDLIVTHVDKSGFLIWSKTYRSRLFLGSTGSGDYFYVQQWEQDPASGDIFFTSPHWSQGKNITRLKLADGAVVWSKFYQLYGEALFDRPFGLVVRNNDLLAFSAFTGYYNGGYTSIFRINKNTGDTISTNFFTTKDSTKFNLGWLGQEEVVRLNNGHYAFSGELFRYYYALNDSISPLFHVGVAEVDSNLNFVKAYSISNSSLSNYFNTRVTVFKDGSGFFSMLTNISGYSADMLNVQFRDGQIIRQRRRRYNGEGIPNEDNSLRVADGGDLVVNLLGDSATGINKIEFLKLHINDSASACTGIDDNSNFIQPYIMEPVVWGLDSIGSNDVRESTNKTLVIANTVLVTYPGCAQISRCDSLKITAARDSVCVSSSAMITIKRNPGCVANVFIGYDTTLVRSYQKINDSLYRFDFKSAGTTSISGSIFGCSLITDSVRITVLNAPGKINLGPDTVICSGNTISLSAKTGYTTYSWQDGSTDSIFVVHQPGTYYVRAVDGCGNMFSDTIIVNPHPPIPFDLGPDLQICEKDTISLQAPPLFLNYFWSPNYRINNLVSSSVKVSPLVNTLYYVKAEKTPGCFVEDSILVTVSAAPAIDLGADKNICSGDSIVLDGGAGFTKYLWNNGKTGQQITIYNAGVYSLIATTTSGCISKDTFNLQKIYTRPVVNLGSDNILCNGTTRLLNAGNFNQYLWNTGSTSQTISISQTGLYSVLVTDSNRCSGSGSININVAAAVPNNFLPPDTSICTYGTLVLHPAGNYTSYLWSNGATGSSITVSNADTYWLEVKDGNNCTGKDSIVLTSKNCLQGIYVPNAFTPGRNGKNDLFMPLVFGNIIKFDFVVYNRWGQIVFRAKQPGKGWDGTYRDKSVPQSSNTYAWTCTYQFENQPVKVEKGIVVLIR